MKRRKENSISFKDKTGRSSNSGGPRGVVRRVPARSGDRWTVEREVSEFRVFLGGVEALS